MADGKFLGGAFILLVVTMATTFFILHTIYSSTDVNDHRGLQTIISGVNTFLCQAYTIKTKQAANSYVLSHPARISAVYDTVVSKNSTFPSSLHSKTYFYLIKGSHIKISTCSKQDAPSRDRGELLLYRGGKCNTPKFKNSKFCPEIRKDVTKCGSRPTVLSYDVPVTENYYIVITDKYVKTDVELKRASFSTRRAKQKCIMSRSCRLETSGSVDIVVLLSDETKDTSFTKICERRTGAWVGVAGIIVGIIGLIILVGIMAG